MAAETKYVGPIIADEYFADAVLQAIEDDNPGSDIQVGDNGGYIRIQTPWNCRITRLSLEKALGRTIKLSELEVHLASFAGRIRWSEDEVTFYLERGGATNA